MLGAVCLRLGWRDGLDYLAAHQGTASVSWGILCVGLGTAGLYDVDRQEKLRSTLVAAIVAVLGGTLLATALLWSGSAPPVAHGILLVFGILALFSVIVMQLIHRLMRRSALMTRRCLVIGTNGEARKTIDLIHRHPHAGIQVVGMVACGNTLGRGGAFVDDYPVLGTEASLQQLVRVHRIDQLIVAAPAEVEPTLLHRLRSFRYRGVALADYVSLHEELTQEIPVEHINEEWLFAASMNNSRPHVRRTKRLFDVVASVAALVMTAPIMAAAAVLVRLGSSGPVFHRQDRVGQNGAPFTILKFRTMAVDAESRTGPVWAIDNDPRITWVGRWLRRFHVDELPQFINVLRGEMSVVGPRPEREVFVNRLAEQIPFYTERFMVRPGITGWAQVTQSYAASLEESRQKLQADLYYIKHMSLPTDVYIMLKTVSIVLRGHEQFRSVNRSGPAVVNSPSLTRSRVLDFKVRGA
jgi:exopolysaccharide biosynthesis polyprenyl glycosylphosphotransferase